MSSKLKQLGKFKYLTTLIVFILNSMWIVILKFLFMNLLYFIIIINLFGKKYKNIVALFYFSIKKKAFFQ